MSMAAGVAALSPGAIPSPPGRCAEFLHMLEGHTDSELTLLCRASVRSADCRAAAAALGRERPWSEAAIQDVCTEWPDSRIEQIVGGKGPLRQMSQEDLDAAVKEKAPEAAIQALPPKATEKPSERGWWGWNEKPTTTPRPTDLDATVSSKPAMTTWVPPTTQPLTTTQPPATTQKAGGPAGWAWWMPRAAPNAKAVDATKIGEKATAVVKETEETAIFHKGGGDGKAAEKAPSKADAGADKPSASGSDVPTEKKEDQSKKGQQDLPPSPPEEPAAVAANKAAEETTVVAADKAVESSCIKDPQTAASEGGVDLEAACKKRITDEECVKAVQTATGEERSACVWQTKGATVAAVSDKIGAEDEDIPDLFKPGWRQRYSGKADQKWTNDEAFAGMLSKSFFCSGVPQAMTAMAGIFAALSAITLVVRSARRRGPSLLGGGSAARHFHSRLAELSPGRLSAIEEGLEDDDEYRSSPALTLRPLLSVGPLE